MRRDAEHPARRGARGQEIGMRAKQQRAAVFTFLSLQGRTNEVALIPEGSELVAGGGAQLHHRRWSIPHPHPGRRASPRPSPATVQWFNQGTPHRMGGGGKLKWRDFCRRCDTKCAKLGESSGAALGFGGGGRKLKWRDFCRRCDTWSFSRKEVGGEPAALLRRHRAPQQRKNGVSHIDMACNILAQSRLPPHRCH
jgi:hypothetical protein